MSLTQSDSSKNITWAGVVPMWRWGSPASASRRKAACIASAFDGCDDVFRVFVSIISDEYSDTLGLVKRCKLRDLRVDGLLGFTTEQTVAQQLDLLFQVEDLTVLSTAFRKQYLPE